MPSKTKEVILTYKNVKFYSPKDKDAFFEWTNKIPYVKKLLEAENVIYLYISGKRIPNDSLRNLIGLFYRYKVNMKQLQIFLNTRNTSWFHDTKRGFWYKRVFG